MSKKVYMILTNGFDPDVRVYKEAKYLVEKEYDVEILCWDRKCEYKEKTEEIIDGIKIKRFHILSQPGTGMKQLGAYLKFMINISKYLKKEKCFYLHCHDLDGAIVGYITSTFKPKVKFVFDMHELYTTEEFSYGKFKIIIKVLINQIYKRSYKIIYVNEEQVLTISNKNKNKLIYLPNYPEICNYMPIEKEKNNKCRINYVGAIRDYDSLKALIDLGKKQIEYSIGLYGTGTAYGQIKEMRLPPNIMLYGQYNGITDIAEIYRKTDILFCSYNPNNYNWKIAYPVKFFESIITMTPIIVSEGTKVAEFVKDNKIGEAVRYGDSKSICAAIERIEKRYEEYVKNIRKISDMYKWEKIVDRLSSVYKEK